MINRLSVKEIIAGWMEDNPIVNPVERGGKKKEVAKRESSTKSPPPSRPPKGDKSDLALAN